MLYVSPHRRLHPYCRSARDIANKHTAQCTQHRATINSSAQAAALGIVTSLVPPNHGPLVSVPFTYALLEFSLSRERSSCTLNAKEVGYIYMLEVSCTAFCAAQLAYTKLCKARMRATARNPTPSWLQPAAPAACIGGVRIHTTVIPVYQVRRTRYSTQQSTQESAW